jgi:hypothetical protein
MINLAKIISQIKNKVFPKNPCFNKETTRINKKMNELKLTYEQGNLIWYSKNFFDENFRTYEKRDEFIRNLLEVAEENCDDSLNDWKENLTEFQKNFITDLEKKAAVYANWKNSKEFYDFASILCSVYFC